MRRWARLSVRLLSLNAVSLACVSQQQQYQEVSRTQQQGVRYEEEEKDQAAYQQEAAHEALSRDKGMQAYLGSVYGTMAGTSGVAALGAVGAMMTPLGAAHAPFLAYPAVVL